MSKASYLCKLSFLFLSINSLTYLDLAHAQLCCVCVRVAYIFITHSIFLKNLNYQFIHLGRWVASFLELILAKVYLVKKVVSIVSKANMGLVTSVRLMR